MRLGSNAWLTRGACREKSGQRLLAERRENGRISEAYSSRHGKDQEIGIIAVESHCRGRTSDGRPKRTSPRVVLFSRDRTF